MQLRQSILFFLVFGERKSRVRTVPDRKANSKKASSHRQSMLGMVRRMRSCVDSVPLLGTLVRNHVGTSTCTPVKENVKIPDYIHLLL